jgi:hypothetical protein
MMKFLKDKDTDQRSRSDLDDEIPLLLDPTNSYDPHLLWFQDNGYACPKFSEKDGLLNLRAKTTIEILNLDDIHIVEARLNFDGL